MDNVRIPVDIQQKDKNINFTLEQDFDTLDILSMSLSNDDVYSSQRGDFGVLIGRVTLNNGFGLQNSKVSVFIPISEVDKQRPEIRQIYPFESTTDTFPNGLRYNLLPRVKQSNESHIPVGTFPDVSDFSNYPTYLEVYEKYYKFTTTTNDVGDYMIFGVPTGIQTIHMDFDLFDTNSFTINADDLVANLGFEDKLNDNENNNVPGFVYLGGNHYQVEPKTNINDMPNIFSQDKNVEIIPFWGDETQNDIGITRCDFNIDYNLRPTAVFFGSVLYPTEGYSIKVNYELSDAFKTEDDEIIGPQIDKDIFPPKNLKIAVWYYENDEEFKLYDVFDGLNDTVPGTFRLNLPMLTDYYIINEFGEYVKSEADEGIPTTANYYFEFFEMDEFYSGRRPLWGGYKTAFTPGFRAPADNDGFRFLGGWKKFNFENRIFSYDIFNNKRKFYTIKTRYRKHTLGEVITPPTKVSNKRLLMDWNTYKTYSNFFNNNFIPTVNRFNVSKINSNIINTAIDILKESYFNDILNDASPEIKELSDSIINFNINAVDLLLNSLFKLNFTEFSDLLDLFNLGTIEFIENDGVYIILNDVTPNTGSVKNTNILTTDDVGGGLFFTPKLANNKQAFWNYPFTGLGDIPDNRFAEVIGNFYAPRFEYAADRISNNESFAVENESYPERLLWLPWKPQTKTGNQWVRTFEWILGVGVSLEGVNKGIGYNRVHGTEEVEKTNERNTWYFGDNKAFNVSSPALNSQSYIGQFPLINRNLPSDFDPINSVYKPYNLLTSEGQTDGLFINSSSQLEKDTVYAEVFIENITDEIEELIKDKVYSSYNKSEDNTYNGKYYYFGKYLGENSLHNIEKIYFNEL